MRLFYHTSLTASFVLLFASVGSANGEGDLERRFAERLDSDIQMQVGALVSSKLAFETAAVLVPAALPPAGPVRHASPVASATSARALPNGELAASRLDCSAPSVGGVQCSVVSGMSDSSLLAIQGR